MIGLMNFGRNWYNILFVPNPYLRFDLSDEPMRKILPFLVIFGLFLILFLINVIYQLINKPAELFGLFASGSYKTTQETWDDYGRYFQRHSTDIMTPEFLCAMAQVESGGNKYATPQWRFRWTSNIANIYAPASSAVGLLQYTDATFKEAKRFCIHDHKVAVAGSLLKPDSCWFNFFYTRLSASDSIEMTSARLHYHINQILSDNGYAGVSLEKKQKLGAVIHLCGLSKGRIFVKNKFNFSAVSPCGGHHPAVYYGRIEIVMNSVKRNRPGPLERRLFKSKFKMK